MLEEPPIMSRNEDMDSIFELLCNPSLQGLFQRIEDEYIYWDKVKYLVPKGTDPEKMWKAVKVKRQLQLQPVQFADRTFYFSIPPAIQQLLHDFDMNMGGSLSSSDLISENDRQVYLINSIMEEAIASSQMEGATTTRKVAKDMLRKNLKPKNKSQQMIVNNFQTIRRLVEEKEDTLNMGLLLDIHKSITAHTLDDANDEGRLRQTDDICVMDSITGDIAHTPPSHIEVEALLHDLFAFANDEHDTVFIHPIVKGIILHFMLAWIHPFVDGNGRTARSLVYWYMLKKNYWLTEYLSISRVIYKSKTRYERSFLCTETDGMDMTYFILHNLQVMKKAYDDLKAYLARKMEERSAILQSSDIEGINERQMQILKLLSDSPTLILTAQEVSNRFGISSRTARTDLNVLADMGHLKRIALNKKQTGFVKATACTI